MSFFRSEALVEEWCKSNDIPKRPLLTLEQLWQMALAWYSGRLSPAAHRPRPDEIRRIFANIGLQGDFWDPQADVF